MYCITDIQPFDRQTLVIIKHGNEMYLSKDADIFHNITNIILRYYTSGNPFSLIFQCCSSHQFE